MKKFIEKNGDAILDILGKGAPNAIAARMALLYPIEKKGQTIRIILKDQVPATFIPSQETYDCIEKTAILMIEEKIKKGLKLVEDYKATQRQAA